MSELCVNVGYACNFKCAHCGVADKPKRSLSGEELTRIVNTIDRLKIRSLLFVGGEPTLYIRDINNILSRIKDLNEIEVRVITNGHFAKTKKAAETVLSKLLRVTKVDLSYDKFHKEFLNENNIGFLYQACKDSGVEFGVLMAIQSPMDLALVPRIRSFGDFPIGVQKVLPTGFALGGGVALTHPSFDSAVLGKKCESSGRVSYICGEGFSLCCSSLVLNGETDGYVHPTLEEHMSSRFYKIMSTKSFRAILKLAGIPEGGLSPENSAPCNLCEYIFKKAKKKVLG